MENKSNYEKTIGILKDNINRILNEKDQSPRWLSLKIEKNAWYITRMLEGKHNPSLQVICKMAEELRVSVADLLTKKEG
ncbi:MAG: helix-turn-helix transcriptional regulator [Oscillospiraceae bacterium]|nr:helix-turn-helix transcriptional regulator [Oscillospiraceae bacterium]